MKTALKMPPVQATTSAHICQSVSEGTSDLLRTSVFSQTESEQLITCLSQNTSDTSVTAMTARTMTNHFEESHLLLEC